VVGRRRRSRWQGAQEERNRLGHDRDAERIPRAQKAPRGGEEEAVKTGVVNKISADASSRSLAVSKSTWSRFTRIPHHWRAWA
jgi:hypothetical protein